MTDDDQDYRLFTVNDGGAPIDPDVALMSAYLAGELTAVQVEAVKRRLAGDDAFRAAVEPVMDAWTVPFDEDQAPRPLFVSRAELDAGWRTIAGASDGQHRGRPSMARRAARAAAVIAVLALPMIGLAQIARQPGDGFWKKVAALLGLSATATAPANPNDQTRAGAVRMHPLGEDASGNGIASTTVLPHEGLALDLAQGGVRPLGPTVAVSPVAFGEVGVVVQQASGRVLVNDVAQRLVLSLDAVLAHPTVVLDSVAGRSNSYGNRLGALIPYLADSTLFVDNASKSILVLAPDNAIARVTAVPPTDIFDLLSNNGTGAAAVDRLGRLVYATRSARSCAGISCSGASRGTGVDSTLLVAFDLQRRVFDTLTSLKVDPQIDGRLFPTLDGWAITSSGTVAVVRGQDYHVDWINTGGKRVQSPKVMYPWHRLSDDEKVHVADSVSAWRDSSMRAMIASMAPGGEVQYDSDGYAQSIRYVSRPPGAAIPPTVTPAGKARGDIRMRPISPTGIPEYFPPFGSRAVRADADGRLWIRTTLQGGLAAGGTFDIVDLTGALIDRVQIPEGRTIVGFGAGGMVYLISHDAGTSRLEKARFR